MKNRIATRLESFDSSVFRDVIEKQQNLINPIDLSVGVPEDETPSHIKIAGIKAIENNFTKYTPANGILELREAMAKKLLEFNHTSMPVDQISVVPGLTTGLLLVYMAILDPGDEIIVMDPGYPPYVQLARALGAEILPVLTLPTFQLDLKEIIAAITDKTKAIVINSPNNPTGAIYPESDLRELAEIAKDHNVYIISDEIYEHFSYDKQHFSVGSIFPDTITLHGFSKHYGMTGWRLGYISGPKDVIEGINELLQYSVFSSSSIAQHAAIEALKNEFNVSKKYQDKRNYLVKELRALGFDIHGAEGSYYVFIKAPKDMTDLEFTELAVSHNLLVVPGRAFSSRHGYIRLSYGVPMETLKKGVEILKHIISVI